MSYCVVIFHTILFFTCSSAWFNDPGKIHISVLKSITLNQGQWTTGRRNPGVSQLKCVGGSAGCSVFVPSVVQCQNVGFDGFDAQWKCETDMEDSYKFGKIQVTCEGYDYPNDPYILRGSCGLEYTIDYTEAGKRRAGYLSHSNESNFGWKLFLFWLVIGFLIYKLFRRVIRCIRKEIHRHRTNSPTSNHHNEFFNLFSSPKPNTEQDGLTPTAPPSYDEATSDSETTSDRQSTHGFWSGFTLGGILSYLFGSLNRSWHSNWYHHHNRHNTRWHYGSTWGSSWRSPVTSSGGSSSSSRTACGYGGTSRR